MIAGLDLVEREHRHEMFDAGEFFAGRAADALRGRFGRDEFGKLFLQFLQLLEKLVVFAVGDELPAFDVIGVVVPADFVGELGVAFFGFGVRHAEIFTATGRKDSSIMEEICRAFDTATSNQHFGSFWRIRSSSRRSHRGSLPRPPAKDSFFVRLRCSRFRPSDRFEAGRCSMGQRIVDQPRDAQKETEQE